MDADQSHFRFYAVTRSKLGQSGIEVHQESAEAWRDAVPSLRTVQRWIKDTNDGARTAFSDAARSGRPRSSRTYELTASVNQAVDDDPHLSSVIWQSS